MVQRDADIARLQADAGALCRDIGERTVASGGLARAERCLVGKLEETGGAVRRHAYPARGTEVANLAVDFGPPGGEPLVVAAHYDTVPGTEGADDNGSAVCVLLGLARRLALRGPATPVRLVLFTLEEAPAFATPEQGSRRYLQDMTASAERTRGAIVLEMVGYTSQQQLYPAPLRWAGYPDRGDFVGIVGNRRSRHLLADIARGFRRNRALPVETLTVPFDGRILPAVRLSDHASFWDAGLPAVMVTDTAFFRNPHYHRPSDRIETLDFDFMARLVDSLEIAIRAMP